jgi:hypothetical protein
MIIIIMMMIIILLIIIYHYYILLLLLILLSLLLLLYHYDYYYYYCNYIYIHYYTLLYGVSSKVDIYKANPDKPRLFFDPASSLTGLERFVCGFGQAL